MQHLEVSGAVRPL